MTTEAMGNASRGPDLMVGLVSDRGVDATEEVMLDVNSQSCGEHSAA